MMGFWQLTLGRPVGRQQFSQPPIRSYYFWVETLFLLMVAAMALFLTAFFRSQLNGQMILTMCFPFVMLTMLWFGVLGVHQAVHEAYRGKWGLQADESENDLRSDMLLDKLAYLSYAGFGYAATAVALAYGALVPIALVARR
jgi:hypothetical protein